MQMNITNNSDISIQPKTVQDNDTLTFEEATKRLSRIVEQLEKGDLQLETSLQLFEEGISLVQSAQNRLNLAEKRVEELLGIDENGKPMTKPFDYSES